MATAFSRGLGFEPGVQLNPTIDSSEGFAVNAVEEQSFGCVARLVRGPIDRAFSVSKANARKITGQPEPIRKNELNNAHTQLLEAVNNGAKRAIVARLVGTDARNRWVVVKKPTQTQGTYNLVFELAEQIPSSDFIFAIKHKGCFNDGIKLAISAKETLSSTNSKVDATVATIKVLDKNNLEIDSFTASLDIESLDADGMPNSLQNFIANYASDDYEVVLSAGANIPKECAAYGKDDNGLQRTQTSNVLYPFTEGSVTSVTTTQYQNAVQLLEDTDLDFAYTTSLGSTSTALCANLAKLAFNKNILCGVDVPGNLTPKQAIAWVNQLGLTNHLLFLTWHPAECIDPNGVSGRVILGTSAYRTALMCGRNAATNAMGFARKQYAIAGRPFPVQRQGMKQLYKPNNDELSDLAEAGITPVIHQTFSGSSGYIFNDAITKSGKATSYLNLINSVDIVTTIERSVCRIAREFLLFMPMNEAIERAKFMIKAYLDDATTSGWLIESNELGGASYQLQVMKNAQRPADVMNIDLKMHPEGCVRQVHITPEVTR
ncbi:hypothetical protein ACWIUH_01420 [Ursidibacter arcticus]